MIVHKKYLRHLQDNYQWHNNLDILICHPGVQCSFSLIKYSYSDETQDIITSIHKKIFMILIDNKKKHSSAKLR